MGENESRLNASDDMFDDNELEDTNPITDTSDSDIHVTSNQHNKHAASDINYSSLDAAAENSNEENILGATNSKEKTSERDSATNNEVNKSVEISEANPLLGQPTVQNKDFNGYNGLSSEHMQFNESNSQDMEIPEESLNVPAMFKKDNNMPSSNLPARQELQDPQDNESINLPDSHAAMEPSTTCPFCNSVQRSLSTLEIHIELSHPDYSNVEMDDGTNFYTTLARDGSDNYCFLGVCPYCDIDLGDEVTLQVHINEVHESDPSIRGTSIFTCPLCGSVCDTEQDMKLHLKTHSNDTPVYGIGTCADTASAMTCPVCGISMTDADLLNSHVESHFNPQHSRGLAFAQSSVPSNTLFSNKNPEDSCQKDKVVSSTLATRDAKDSTIRDAAQSGSTTSFSASTSRGDNFGYKKQYEQNLEKAVVNGQLSVSDYHEKLRSMKQHDLKGIDDGSTRVSGLIQKLETLYRTQARQGQSAILCSPMDHYSASYGDKGWGCGYRNFQMLLSCLSTMPVFSARIFPDQQKELPSIPKIQEMIELAWQHGFDPQGCRQLNGKLVDTKKWIGATEIVATLSYLGIKCQLADFHSPSSDDGTHPRLIQWVSDYFKKGQTEGLRRSPLYLQHQGHSRTIVGVEYDKGATKLLLFDPGTPKDQLVRGSLSWKDLRVFRRTQAGFRAKQYQIVAVVGLLAGNEYQESKILKSERVS